MLKKIAKIIVADEGKNKFNYAAIFEQWMRKINHIGLHYAKNCF